MPLTSDSSRTLRSLLSDTGPRVLQDPGTTSNKTGRWDFESSFKSADPLNVSHKSLQGNLKPCQGHDGFLFDTWHLRTSRVLLQNRALSNKHHSTWTATKTGTSSTAKVIKSASVVPLLSPQEPLRRIKSVKNLHSVLQNSNSIILESSAIVTRTWGTRWTLSRMLRTPSKTHLRTDHLWVFSFQSLEPLQELLDLLSET